MKIRAIVNYPNQESAGIIEGTTAQVMGQLANLGEQLKIFCDVAFLVGTDGRTRRSARNVNGQEWAVLIHTL